jgi:ABC-type transporter Mla subunit MlaD
MSRASEELPGALREVRSLIADLRRTSTEIEGAAAGVRTIMGTAGPDISSTLERVRVVAENLARTSARLDQFVAQNQANVSRFSDRGLVELERLIRDSREAAQEFRELTRSLKNNPAQLIYEQKYPGVEIAR